MKTLVIGGNGFIGCNLVDRLLSEGHTVSVLDRQPELYRKPLKDVIYYIQDFGNRSLLDDALKGIDVVFHFVSTTVPKTSNDDPIFDVSSNVIETLYLLERCVEKKVSKLIYISSGGTVYGIPTELPVREDASTNPNCSYGITKLMIEKYLDLFHRLYGLDYTVIRPSNPYGPHQNINGIQGVLSVFLGKIAKNEAIKIWGDGEVIRDYVFIDDLVEGIYKATKMKTSSRVFNMGGGRGYSINEIVNIIKIVLGIDFNVEYLPGRSFDIPQIYLDCSRAENELLWHATTSMPQGIKKTWEFVNKIVENSFSIIS